MTWSIDVNHNAADTYGTTELLCGRTNTTYLV